MIIVTGAAGFIGSNLVHALNARGETDIVAVDNLTRADKFRNLVDCEIADYVDKREFLLAMLRRALDGASRAIFHQGACSDTMETDGRYMMENNFRYSLALLELVPGRARSRCVYASSAAVYGGGQRFARQRECEQPLNVYGYSKFLFDQIVRRRLPRRPQRRSSGCATSTSTGRARRTRAAWLRSPSTTSASSAKRAGSGCSADGTATGAGEQTPRLHPRRRRRRGEPVLPRQSAGERNLQPGNRSGPAIQRCRPRRW